MIDRVCTFDMEIARPIPEEGGLFSEGPLGISIAATLSRPQVDCPSSPRPWIDGGLLWFGWVGKAAPRMDAVEAGGLVNHLRELVAWGYTIVSWNGLGFDFRVLARESGRVEECRKLAIGHIDLMYDFFCRRGFAIGLAAAAKGLEVEGKLEGVKGKDAPDLWARGEFELATRYARQDVQATMNVWDAIISTGGYKWISRRGKEMEEKIKGGIPLRVYEAARLPLPDVSWLDNPWAREKFDGWLRDEYCLRSGGG